MLKNTLTQTSLIAMTTLALVGAGTVGAQAAATGKVLCYVWADQASPTVNVPYTPDPTYSFNSKHKPNSVVKFGTGDYGVTCSGVGGAPSQGPGGHVQVSSYGELNTFCHVEFWSTGEPDFFAEVLCFGKGGGTGGGPAPADSNFDLLFLR